MLRIAAVIGITSVVVCLAGCGVQRKLNHFAENSIFTIAEGYPLVSEKRFEGSWLVSAPMLVRVYRPAGSAQQIAAELHERAAHLVEMTPGAYSTLKSESGAVVYVDGDQASYGVEHIDEDGSILSGPLDRLPEPYSVSIYVSDD